MNLFVLNLYETRWWLWRYDEDKDTNVLICHNEYDQLEMLWQAIPPGAWIKCSVGGRNTDDISEFWESFYELLKGKPYVLSF